jgi:hypothetical protein
MTILNFTSQKFYEGKSDQGLTMKMESEDMEVGKVLYVATDEGMIPAPAGVYMMEDGAEVTVDDMGMVSKIKMGKMEETKDAEKEEKDEETVIKDDEMAESREIPPHPKKDGDIELKDGTVLRLSTDKLEEGVRLKKVGYDGTLSAIHDGDYETKGGEVITVTGGQIVGVMSVKEKKMEGGEFKDEFVKAKTAEGAIVESPTFDVGESIDVMDGDEKKPAPDGEHQIMLKDSEGNEVKIRVMVKDGKIVERENVEEKEDDMSAFATAFAEAMKRIETKLDSIENKYSTLETKFNKFSNEPAGTKIPKQLNQDTFSKPVNSKVEGFKRLRESLYKN